MVKLQAHSVMFHHFHDIKKHIVEQGSISADELNALLDYHGKTYNIISADEFLFKSRRDTLLETDACLSFDDGLLCQYDVAYPVLKQRGLRAFWFIYTSPLKGVLEKLEIYRHFRFSKFNDIEDFYAAFFEIAKNVNSSVEGELENFDPNNYGGGGIHFTLQTTKDLGILGIKF